MVKLLEVIIIISLLMVFEIERGIKENEKVHGEK